MREVTDTYTVYKFDELSERAKERAREWFRRGDDFDASDMLDDFAETAEKFGLDIRKRTATLGNGSTRPAPSVYFSGFYSQGDGASYSGSYSYERGSVRKVLAERPTDTELIRIVRTLQEVQRRNFYAIAAGITQSGRYVHSHTLQFDIERTDDGELSNADEDTIREALRDFADWMYKGLQDAYEWQYSDECVDENIRANEYEFTEDGEIA